MVFCLSSGNVKLSNGYLQLLFMSKFASYSMNLIRQCSEQQTCHNSSDATHCFTQNICSIGWFSDDLLADNCDYPNYNPNNKNGTEASVNICDQFTLEVQKYTECTSNSLREKVGQMQGVEQLFHYGTDLYGNNVCVFNSLDNSQILLDAVRGGRKSLTDFIGDYGLMHVFSCLSGIDPILHTEE